MIKRDLFFSFVVQSIRFLVRQGYFTRQGGFSIYYCNHNNNGLAYLFRCQMTCIMLNPITYVRKHIPN